MRNGGCLITALTVVLMGWTSLRFLRLFWGAVFGSEGPDNFNAYVDNTWVLLIVSMILVVMAVASF